MKKRWGTLLLAGLLGTAVLSGCGSSASDSASTAAADSAAAETTTSSENTKEDLIFVNYRDIRDLNPHLYAGEMYAQEMLYEGLVNITADGFEGCLAESWDVSEDGKVMNVSGGTAVMRDKEGYRGIPKAYIQGWGQGLALSFFATLLISDDIEKDGAL